MLLYHSKWIGDQKTIKEGSLMPITPQSEAARALVQAQRDNSSEPIVCRFAITRFPSSRSEAGFP